jgi:hypothetical protein
MQSPPEQATIAGTPGALLLEDDHMALWEVRVTPQRLADILAACSGGRTLAVGTAAGAYQALVRRLWVLPAGQQLLVRISLELRAAA